MGFAPGKLLLEEFLLEEGILHHLDLDAAKAKAAERGLPLKQVLISDGFVSEHDMARAEAAELGLTFVDLTRVNPSAEAVALVPERFARRYGVMPVAVEKGSLVVAIKDPADLIVANSLSQSTSTPVIVCFATREQLRKAIERAYPSQGASQESDDESQPLVRAGTSGTEKSLAMEGSGPHKLSLGDKNEPSVEDLLNMLIAESVHRRASDIHIEPEGEIVRVRTRIDGALMELTTFRIERHPQVISRLKILANLDIAERRNAQDGSFQIKVEGRGIDLRLSTLPTVRGEKAVLRILDKSSLKVRLEDLAMTSEMLLGVRQILDSPYGIILVTGPTGSGKTTTVYSMLNQINSMDKNIITVEDPVEFQFGLINQVQVNPRAGLTFAGVLRNILRQDPDVIMIGEIRDAETATLANRAALTGHLVISTIHTNDSISTINRIVDMGVESYLLSSSLLAVISQRLVRVLCHECRRPTQLSEEDRQRLGTNLPPNLLVFEGEGCAHCGGTGYSGRQCLFEFLRPDAEMKKLIAANRPFDEIFTAARQRGFKTMKEHGLEKMKAGITSPEEVIKATI